MQISVKITLNPRQKRKDGSRTIVCRIIKDRIPAYIPTDYSIDPDNFILLDDDEFALKKDSRIKNLKLATNQINILKKDILSFIELLIDNGKINGMSSTEIKAAFLNKSDGITLNSFMKDQEIEMRKANRQGNADIWKYSEIFLLNALGVEIEFSKFDLKTIKKLETYHLANNPGGINGLSAYLRTIRTAYYAYAKQNRIKLDYNPWNDYQIRSKRTRKRATSADILKLFRDFEIEPGTKKDAQEIYLLSFYLAGMNLIDLAKLKVNQIVNNKIHYSRTKIGEEISIPIPDQAMTIFKRFIEGKNPDDYVLPILEKDRSEEENHTLYKSRRDNYNDHINSIFKAIGVVSDKRITFYSARHTWASRANELNKPLTAISQGLGHTDIKTTQIYLDDLQDNILDEVNKDVIDLD